LKAREHKGAGLGLGRLQSVGRCLGPRASRTRVALAPRGNLNPRRRVRLWGLLIGCRHHLSLHPQGLPPSCRVWEYGCPTFWRSGPCSDDLVDSSVFVTSAVTDSENPHNGHDFKLPGYTTERVKSCLNSGEDAQSLPMNLMNRMLIN
jgi:hypothetical protein